MDIMLVRRITRPVTARRVNLDNNESMAWETRREDAVDLPCSMIAPTDLNLNVRWRDQAWFMILVAWCQSDGNLARGFSINRQRCTAWKIKSIWQAMEDAVSFADV
jgi:hypothetical protein